MNILNYIYPKSLDDGYHILKNNPKAQIIGGGAWLKQINKPIETCVDLKELNLNYIKCYQDMIEIGAQSTLRDVEMHPEIYQLGQGVIRDAISSILGVAFRNSATIGGTIFGRYAFSDVISALLLFDVSVHFHHHGPIALSDYLSYKGKIKDILTHITIKKEKLICYFKKVSHSPLDFATLNIAISYQDNQFKVVLGARPGIATYLYEVMDVLNQASKIDVSLIDKAIAQIDLSLMGSNPMASNLYRHQLACVYVKRGIMEVLNHES